MNDKNQYFKDSKYKDYLYVIKENISIINPAYTNDPLNMYLLLGNHSALLLDTGCGLYPLKPVVNKLIGERKLLVCCTHAHFDHVLGNFEFDEVFIHENEKSIISKSYDVSYFKDSPNEIVKVYAKQDFLIPPALNVKSLRNGDIFDLGGIKIEVIHCPGHSPGSICLLTTNNELFTSDVAYYGDQFLPKREDLPQVLETLSKLIDLCKERGISELYPSHRNYPCDITLLTDLYEGINNIENLWQSRVEFDFFHSWQIDDPNGKFRYYVSIS